MTIIKIVLIMNALTIKFNRRIKSTLKTNRKRRFILMSTKNRIRTKIKKKNLLNESTHSNDSRNYDEIDVNFLTLIALIFVIHFYQRYFKNFIFKNKLFKHFRS